MRVTKAMLEIDLNYQRRISQERKKKIFDLEVEIKTLKDNMAYMRSFGDNLSKGFNACEVVANTVSHALRLQMNANGVR